MHMRPDYTVKLGLKSLPNDTEIFVRSYFRSAVNGKTSKALRKIQDPVKTVLEPCGLLGRVILAVKAGINPEIGGYRIFKEIAKDEPNLFFNCGDVIYADGPLKLERSLPGKQTWYNLVTPEKEHVAQSLRQFRGNYRYNYLDENLRRFSAQCPQTYIWDDHETKNNWWPTRKLRDRRYQERRCRLLSTWARQSFFEYLPVAQKPTQPRRLYRKLSQGSLADVFVLDTRSYRGPNSKGTQSRMNAKTSILGTEQLAWLIDGLRSSTAVWKLIICPQPIGLNINGGSIKFDGIGNGFEVLLGRELEIAQLP